MGKLLKILGDVVFFIVLTLLITVGATAYLNRNEENGMKFGDYKVLTVLTGSMMPTISPGSMILIKQIPFNELEVGDIVTFKSNTTDNTLVTHRIASATKVNDKPAFVTRGDANKVDDDNPITQANVVGKTIYWVPGIGKLLIFVRTTVGTVTLLLCVCISMIFSTVHERIKKKEKNVDKELVTENTSEAEVSKKKLD